MVWKVCISEICDSSKLKTKPATIQGKNGYHGIDDVIAYVKGMDIDFSKYQVLAYTEPRLHLCVYEPTVQKFWSVLSSKYIGGE